MTQESVEERLIWLLKVSRSMLATRDMERLLSLITDAFIELTEAHRGFLLLRDPETGKVQPRVARAAGGLDIPPPDPRSASVINRVFKDKRAVYATDTSSQEGAAAKRSPADHNLKMVVCVPLCSESEAIGVLYGDGHTSLDRVFTSNNRNTVELLAEHATAAIENARVFERATNDPLTGLPNSSYFLMQLSKVMRDASERMPAGILLLDLDAFKRVNLVAGAEAGDRALLDVATTLQDVLRTDGLVARYGSDKFAVLLPPDDTSTPIGVRLRDVAERARAAVRTKTFHGVHLSACIGGVSFPAEGSAAGSAPDVVAYADDVLAKARARGAGEVEVN